MLRELGKRPQNGRPPAKLTAVGEQIEYVREFADQGTAPRLAPRGSVSFPTVKLRSGFSLMPFMESAMANVYREYAHGDQQEDIIWVVI